MKIGILSDTHNAQDNTKTALAALRERGVAQIIHCGDLTTPEMVYLFSGWRVTFVLGNMDRGGMLALGEAANQIGAARPRDLAEVRADDMLIGVTHGDNGSRLQSMIVSGKYAVVCHGHTHRRRDEHNTAYSVRVLNPGALGGNHPEARSVCVLDTVSGGVEFITFPDMP